ncbi:MAG: response regulator [Candidatus Omnitrophica bacterium]|nr:response regulator [Candidatus Omnitrophota bacterium]
MKKKVMVVDDEFDFLKIVKLNLEQAGEYEVMTLLNPKEIIQKLHQFKPNIILLDILMPQIGGLEACEMLNNDSLGKNIPIVILSALEKDEDKLRAYKVGVVDYLVKPIEKKDLIAKIEKALKHKQEKNP